MKLKSDSLNSHNTPVTYNFTVITLSCLQKTGESSVGSVPCFYWELKRNSRTGSQYFLKWKFIVFCWLSPKFVYPFTTMNKWKQMKSTLFFRCFSRKSRQYFFVTIEKTERQGGRNGTTKTGIPIFCHRCRGLFVLLLLFRLRYSFSYTLLLDGEFVKGSTGWIN